jgi:hypothetical protein
VTNMDGNPELNGLRRRLQRLSRADVLVLVGIVAWIVAQFLPAYRADSLFAGVVENSGFSVTAVGWANSIFDDQPILLLGWTANVWLLVVLVARVRRRHERIAVAAAVIAELTALIGIWALATFDTSESVLGLEIGAWVWLAGVTLIVVGVGRWGVRRLPRDR